MIRDPCSDPQNCLNLVGGRAGLADIGNFRGPAALKKIDHIGQRKGGNRVHYIFQNKFL